MIYFRKKVLTPLQIIIAYLDKQQKLKEKLRIVFLLQQKLEET